MSNAGPRTGTAPLLTALGVLTVLATALGLLPWPKNERRLPSDLQRILDQPLSVWLLAAGTAVVTIVTAELLFRRAASPAAPPVVRVLLSVLFVVSAAAGLANAFFFARSAGPSLGPIIPVLHWAFTFVPSLLAGLLLAFSTGRLGLQAALAAAEVAVPIQALSWALLVRFTERGPAVTMTFLPIAILVLAPVGVAVAIVLAVQSGQLSEPPPPALSREV